MLFVLISIFQIFYMNMHCFCNQKKHTQQITFLIASPLLPSPQMLLTYLPTPTPGTGCGGPSGPSSKPGRLSFGFSRTEGQLQATSTSVLSARSSRAGGRAQGQASTVEGPSVSHPQLFLCLPSPTLGTKFPGLISVPRPELQECCSASILTAPTRTFSYASPFPLSPRKDWEGSRREPEPIVRGDVSEERLGAATNLHALLAHLLRSGQKVMHHPHTHPGLQHPRDL